MLLLWISRGLTIAQVGKDRRWVSVKADGKNVVVPQSLSLQLNLSAFSIDRA
jgi:hypothetical protein